MEEKLAAYRRRKAFEMQSNNSVEKESLIPKHDQSAPHTNVASEKKQFMEPTDGNESHSLLENITKFKVVDRTLSLLSCGFWQMALKVCIWICLFTFFVSQGFGSVFVVLSGFYFMYTSMSSGSRTSAEPSAYSVFNDGFERLDGTFTAEQFERELKGGLLP